jgi:hypothetical protein
MTLIPTQLTAKNSTVNLAWKADNVLLSLDNNGHLASLVDNHDWATLRESVESVLPLTTWFNLTVYDKDMNILNEFPISNAGTVSDTIVSVDYICVSQNSNYTIYVLQLQLSVVD